MDGLPGYYTESAVPTCSRTLRNAIDCQGVGLHSGRNTRLALIPATAGTGIVFHRADLGIDIAARYDMVADARLCTKLTSPEHPDASIGTVEHLMAALAATGIDTLRIEIDGPEVPIFDGSAAPFLFLIDCAGIVDLSTPRDMIEIIKTVSVEDNGAVARFEPLPPGGAWLGLDIAMSIDFAATAIGQQSFNLRLSEQSFRAEVAEARTFVQAAEIEQLRAAGLARGGNMSNAIVVDGEQVLNPAGLRMANEFVRHKALDAVGDLSLAGATILGRFIGNRSGHRINNLLLRALFADAEAWRPITMGFSALGMGSSRAFGGAARMPMGVAASAA